MKKIIEKINNSKSADYIRKHQLIKKYPALKQVIKFAVIGNINNIIDFGIYISLTRGFPYWKEHYLLANLIAFMISVLATFDIVRIWIFKLPILPRDEDEGEKVKLSQEEERNIHIQYFKFLFISFIFFGLNEAGLFVFVEFLRIHDIIAKLIAAFIVWIMRFNIHKFWTFKSEGQEGR